MSDDPEIDAIHAEFRAGLPARVARMRELASSARAGSREALEELRVMAHRLRGACGSFAMRELEEPSRVVEYACKQGTVPVAVDTALDDLERLIAG